MSKMAQCGLDMRFGAAHCGIWKGVELVIGANRVGNVYALHVELEKAMYQHAMYVEHEDVQSEWELWHPTPPTRTTRTRAVNDGLPNI